MLHLVQVHGAVLAIDHHEVIADGPEYLHQVRRVSSNNRSKDHFAFTQLGPGIVSPHGGAAPLNQDSPYRTKLPEPETLWNAAYYNSAFQIRQLPLTSFKFPDLVVGTTNISSAKAQNHLFLHKSLPWGNPFDLGDRVITYQPRHLQERAILELGEADRSVPACRSAFPV